MPSSDSSDASAAVTWRETRDANNLLAYLEWERERAKLYREFRNANASWMMDDEPERKWTEEPRAKKSKKTGYKKRDAHYGHES